MGKIDQNPKIGQLRRPVVPQTYVVKKSWPDFGNSLALGLQRGVNGISLQCIPWPVACSRSGACLTDFRFQILGANDPERENFRKCLSAFLDGTSNYVSWPNLVKIGSCEESAVAKLPNGRLDYHTKNSRSAGLVPAPILPKMGRLRPKFPNIVTPWRVHVYRSWSESGLCRIYLHHMPVARLWKTNSVKIFAIFAKSTTTNIYLLMMKFISS